MDIVELKERQNVTGNKKWSVAYAQFGALREALTKKSLSPEVRDAINQDIHELNSIPAEDDHLLKMVKDKQSKILKLLEKELKIVPKNHYRNLWMAVGMSAFGLPLGLAFGLSLGNIGLMAIGLPIGMAIGTAVGSGMDKKASVEGKQLDVELKP